MISAALDHPNTVLDTLLAKGGRAHRLARLTALHEICRRHQGSGSRDFSLPTIGRLVETEGILKGRVLYNMQSADYRELISAWAMYAGPVTSQSTKPLASHEYLMRIHDPAIRSIMQTIIGDRDKLRRGQPSEGQHASRRGPPPNRRPCTGSRNRVADNDERPHRAAHSFGTRSAGEGGFCRLP